MLKIGLKITAVKEQYILLWGWLDKTHQNFKHTTFS